MVGRSPVLKKKILSYFRVNEEDLRTLCRQMSVKSLAVFGSVIQGEFKAGQSDIDFLEGLKKLFHYNDIDLVTAASLKNQVIRQQILSSKEDLYAA